MRSEAVPAADAEKKEENLRGDQKVEAPKENTTPIEPEPLAAVPAAVTASPENEKMDIEEPIQEEKESPVVGKDSAEPATVPAAANASIEDKKDPAKRSDIHSAPGNDGRSCGGNSP